MFLTTEEKIKNKNQKKKKYTTTPVTKDYIYQKFIDRNKTLENEKNKKKKKKKKK